VAYSLSIGTKIRDLEWRWTSYLPYLSGKHCEITARTERTCPSRHAQEANCSYSSGAWRPPLAADKLPYWLQNGFTSSQSTVNWQSSLSSSVGQWLHACQTDSVIKAAFLTKSTSENWNHQTRLQRSCSNYLERPTARFTLRCYTRTIPICDKETFYELAFMNWSRDCLRSHDSFLLTTYGALSNTYNNNNNFALSHTDYGSFGAITSNWLKLDPYCPRI